jgi:hypothetical protein
MGEFYGNQHTASTYSDYDHEDLVEAVAELAEELGRPPTTEDANQAEDMPSIATLYRILKDDWASTLREAGVEPTKEQRRSVPSDRREQMLADLRRTNRETEGDTLRLRQYDKHGSFSGSSMKERFGSWAEACEAADLECGTRHGIQCTGPQGNRLDSQHERLVAAFLDDCGVEFEVHPDVADLGYESDFYLPDVDLWVEVDGYVAGGRPNVANMEAKRDYFELNNYDYVVVKDGDELAELLRERDVFLG